jgi:hypothetical protein
MSNNAEVPDRPSIRLPSAEWITLLLAVLGILVLLTEWRANTQSRVEALEKRAGVIEETHATAEVEHLKDHELLLHIDKMLCAMNPTKCLAEK